MTRRTFIGTGIAAVLSALSAPVRAIVLAADEAAKPLGAYWRPCLERVSAKVNQHAASCADGFWFITDLHMGANKRQSGKVLTELAQTTSLGKVICGGDLPDAFATSYPSPQAGVDYAVDLYRTLWVEPIEATGTLMYTARGNHDYAIRQSSKSQDGFTYAATEVRRRVMNSKGCAAAITNAADPTACYYYFDNAAARIRYIVADTSDSVREGAKAWGTVTGMHETQLLWLADQAISTLPEGWGAVVAHHIPITGVVGTAGERSHYKPFRQLLEAYQNRGTTTLCGKTYDFSTAKGRILLDITGHHHGEAQTFQKGILHVTEPCDAAYSDYILRSQPWCGELPKKAGKTIFEQTFDAVQIDRTNERVYLTRVGGGQDRVIHTKPQVVKVGATLSLSAALLEGPVTWGCYDGDRVEYLSVPNNRYQRRIQYFTECATISEAGVLTAQKPGDVMVIARDAALNKEIFPVTIKA